MRNEYKILGGKPTEKRPLADRGVDRRLMLNMS
jgi:hypothetical protein